MSSDSSSSTSSNSPYEKHRGRIRLLEEPSSSTASFKSREPKKRYEFARLTTDFLKKSTATNKPIIHSDCLQNKNNKACMLNKRDGKDKIQEKKSRNIEAESQQFEPQPSTSYASNNRQNTIAKHDVKVRKYRRKKYWTDRSSSEERISKSRRSFTSSSSSSSTDVDRIKNKHRNKSSSPPRTRHHRSKSSEKYKREHKDSSKRSRSSISTERNTPAHLDREKTPYFSDPKREIERRMRLMENNSRVYRRSRSPIHRRRRSPERCRHPSHSAYLEYPNYSMQPSTHFIYYTSPPWNPSMMHPVPFNRPPFIPPYGDYLMRPHLNYGPRMPFAVPRMRYRYPGPPRYPGSYLFNRPRQNF